jgi:hypothetical protein
MSESPPSVSQDVKSASDAASSIIDSIPDTANIGEVIRILNSEFKKVGSAANSLSEGLTSSAGKVNGLFGSLFSSGQDTSGTRPQPTPVKEMPGATDKSTIENILNFLSLSIQTRVLGDLGSMVQTSGGSGTSAVGTNATNLSGSFTAATSTIKQLPGKIPKMALENRAVDSIERQLKSADSIAGMRSNLLASAAAAGKLNEMLGDMSNVDIRRLNEQVKNSWQDMSLLAASVGTTTENYKNFYMTLQQASPDLLRGESIKVGNRNLSETQAAIALSEGTGRDLTNIKTHAERMGNIFNMSAKDSFDYISKLSKASDQFKIGIGTIDEFAKKNAEAFSFMSDSGDNSVLTLNRMMKSFQDTGLSAKQATTLIGEMTSGIGSMDVAQKAFLSSQTGGPGGLRGAFEIEGLIRKNDIDGVMKKIEQSMRKNFGGKIYSLEDAQQSDYAASQFMAQRELLKSGAFGVKIDSDAKATRVLEAMSNGFKPQADDMNDSFEKYAGAGKTIMESNMNSFSTANLTSELLKLEVGLKNANKMFDIFGLSKEEKKIMSDLGDKTIKNSSQKDRTGNRYFEIAEPISKLNTVFGALTQMTLALHGNKTLSEREGILKDAADKFLKLISKAVDFDDESGADSDADKNKGKEKNKKNTPKQTVKTPALPAPPPKPTPSPAASSPTAKSSYNFEAPKDTEFDQIKLPQIQSAKYASIFKKIELPQQAKKSMFSNFPDALELNLNKTQNASTVADADGKIVVPTVEMHLDMTCNNCSQKVREVVVINSKQNEVGGITSVPSKRRI